MYHTKIFESLFLGKTTTDRVDAWLNSLKNPYVVGYQSYGSSLLITVFERPAWQADKGFQRTIATTIDEIPEEPTIRHD